MDAVALANYQDFMTELMVSRQIVFGHEDPLLAELSGVRKQDYVVTRDPNQQRYTKAMDGGRGQFHGKKVTVPLQLSDVSSAAIAEKGNWPQAAPFDTDQATYNLHSRITPISVTLELERDARNGSTSAMESIAAYTESAYRAAARTDEDFLHGAGDAWLADGNDADVDGLTMTVGTDANFDQLTVGRIADVLVKTTGADPGQGKRRKIESVDRAAGTVTFSTTQVASDGGVGNITLSTNGLGIYIDSSYGNAPAGLGRVCSATDTTYGGIDKTAVAQWQGVRVDGGSATLGDSLLDEAIYYLRGKGVGAPDFGMAHPLTVDPYKNSKSSLVRVEPQQATVPSGFKGIVYQGADEEFPILKALSAPRKKCRLVTKSSMRIYGDEAGPGFIDDDGARFRFFNRTTAKEADLFDRWELVARDCGKNAEIHTLSE